MFVHSLLVEEIYNYRVLFDDFNTFDPGGLVV